jgi:branched-chain amino acid transport system ATP-binding protein
VLEIDDVHVFYGDLQALWGVSARVEAGEIVALLGPNGAGKTTLLRTITGLLRPASGAVRFEGRELHRELPHRIVGLGVSLVPEGRRLFAGMSVFENLRLGAYVPAARAQRNDTLDRVFEIFPLLAERGRQVAGTLSGGEQQMLAIGRALMARPRILLLDEPSLGLAPLIVGRIVEVIRRLHNEWGITVLLVEQNVHAALGLADRAYVMENGRIVTQGTAAALQADPRMRDAYLDLLSAT